jgi:hypothetical protein
MGRRAGGTWIAAQERQFSKPQERFDGEMYERPSPNPFTDAWCDGYDAGTAGQPRYTDGMTKAQVVDYEDGYDCGEKQREQMEREQSSNV